MKKSIFIVIAFLLMSFNLSAQSAVKWKFKIVAVENDVYTVEFQANIDDTWHMYSQHLPSPDEGPLPLVFGFDESENIELIGEVEEEKDKIHSVKDEAFGVQVTYFDGLVTFTQKVKLKSPNKATLSGYISYMTCNETMCVPNDLDFSIPIGG